MPLYIWRLLTSTSLLSQTRAIRLHVIDRVLPLWRDPERTPSRSRRMKNKRLGCWLGTFNTWPLNVARGWYDRATTSRRYPTPTSLIILYRGRLSNILKELLLSSAIDTPGRPDNWHGHFPLACCWLFISFFFVLVTITIAAMQPTVSPRSTPRLVSIITSLKGLIGSLVRLMNAWDTSSLGGWSCDHDHMIMTSRDWWELKRRLLWQSRLLNWWVSLYLYKYVRHDIAGHFY